MIRVVSSVLALRMVGIGFQLGWFMLLVRLLPMEAVGVYAAINAGWALMRAIGPLGSDQALMRRLPELLEDGRLGRARRIQALALRFGAVRLGALLLLAAAGALAGNHLFDWQIAPWMFPLIAFVALCYGINGQQIFVMLAAKRPLLANSWETLWLPILLAAAALGLDAAGSLSLASLLIAQGGIMLGFCVAGMLVSRWLLSGGEEAPALSKDEGQDFAKQSYALLATAALIHVNLRLPVMIAPLFIGAAATAILEAALRFATLLGLMQVAAGQVSLPKISALAQQGNIAKLQQLLIPASWLVFAPTVVMALGLLVLGAWLIALVAGEGYGAAYAPMLVLAAGYVINASSGPLQHAYTMGGRARSVTQISAAELIVSLGLTVLLASEYGAIGMAIAIAVGMSLRNVLFQALAPAQLSLQPGVVSPKSAAWLKGRLC